MQYIGVLKRVLPFILTFAVGLFIASFFVSIASPSTFNFKRGSHRGREVRQLRIENERIKRENADLRRQLEEAGTNAEWVIKGAPFEGDAPPPPPPPAKRPHRVLIDR